jgi:hypothetical protein
MQKAFVCLILALIATTQVAGQATYELTFDSPWSAATHPGAYPGGAHFSPLIGGTHDGSVSYWELDGIATNAIERMAEVGATVPLRNLVLGDINEGGAATVVEAGGINAPGSVAAEFTVSTQHPLLTLVSMIAPSPDWFVGVSGLDFRSDGQWVESLSLDLINYDAGTDAGANFSSPNMDITPHIPISVLGPPLEGMPPLGTFTFTLTESTALCDFDVSGGCDIADRDELLSVGPIASGVAVEFGTNSAYDLNGDDVIDLSDRDQWLAGAAAENGFASPYSAADANLDGFVDGLDFIAWNGNKFTTSLAASDGDFNGDGFVDGLDFIVWNGDKFTSIDGAAVPEPGGSAVVLCVMMAMGTYRRWSAQRQRYHRPSNFLSILVKDW